MGCLNCKESTVKDHLKFLQRLKPLYVKDYGVEVYKCLILFTENLISQGLGDKLKSEVDWTNNCKEVNNV